MHAQYITMTSFRMKGGGKKSPKTCVHTKSIAPQLKCNLRASYHFLVVASPAKNLAFAGQQYTPLEAFQNKEFSFQVRKYLLFVTGMEKH